jgi:hypothetical protein
MNELQDSELKRPLDKAAMGQEVKMLDNLLGFLNNPNITGADAPKVPKSTPVPVTAAPAIAGADTVSITEPTAPARPKPITAQRFAFSGRLKVGKDHAANALGAKIFGFADPLYALQDHFFGTSAGTDPRQKDIPGARAFLQAAGQWGWGCVSEKYPLTPARACFTTMVRSLGRAGLFPADLQVDWDSFGRDKEIWVKAALRRIDSYSASHPGHRIAIVNARFDHEFALLKSSGFEHYHVMCSPKTHANRLVKAGLTDKSPVVNDESEQLAKALDADVIRKISGNRSGPMLKVVWNDDESPSPSPRLYSLSNFLAALAPNEPVGIAAQE